MLHKLLKRLFKVPEAPEPKGVLKIVKNISALRYDIQFKMDNGEVITTTLLGKNILESQDDETHFLYKNPLDLGYKRTFPKKFLGLLDQYGLSTKVYDKKYLYYPDDKIYIQPELHQYNQLAYKGTFVEIAPGTIVTVNNEKVRSIVAIENRSGHAEVTEHKVKE